MKIPTVKKLTVTGCILIIVAASIYAWYARAGGKEGSDARYYGAKYDAETDEMGRCAMADLAGHYFGKVGDRENFDRWVSLRQSACEKAGVNAPAPRLELGAN